MRLRGSIKLTGRSIKHSDGGWPTVGDTVDECWADYVVGVIPPAFMGSCLIQIGEPHDHDGPNGEERYSTIQHSGSNWIYTGNQTIRTMVVISD